MVVIPLGFLVTIQQEVIVIAQSPASIQNSEELEKAKRLNAEGMKVYQEGKHNQAIPLLKSALSIREKTLGEEHPDVVESLNNLALVYEALSNYDALQSLYLRTLNIYEKILGKEHQYVANILNKLARVYQLQGNYQTCEGLYLRSIAIYEQALGKFHPDVGQTLNNLAQLYKLQGNYIKAESLLLRSLTIYEKALGKSHSDVAIILNNLGQIYELQGDYAQAESFYLRSLAIYKKLQNNTDIANILNNLGQLYKLQGSYKKAESLLLRSLEITEKVLGKSHPDVATTLNNLAFVYESQGNYLKAESLLLRSLEIDEKVLGKFHPDLATTLNNLGFIYESQENYQQAESFYLRSLKIRKKILGNSHPDVAQSLNNLAFIYESQGNYQKAEPLYLNSLAMWEKFLGLFHPDVAKSLNHLARLYWVQNDINRTVDFLNRGLTIEEKNLQLIYAVGSEKRKNNYAQKFNLTTNTVITLALKYQKNPTIAKLALTTILRRKGRVLDAVTDTVQILRANLADNPEIQNLFDNWLKIRQELSALVYRGQNQQKIEVYQQQIQKLQIKKEKLEEQMSSKSAEFRQEIKPIELAPIQAKIPQNAALVEIIQYQPFNPKAKYQKRFDKPRYAAVVLRSQSKPKWVDLGDAVTIDKSVNNFRKALKSTASYYKKRREKVARELDNLIMAPIRPLFADASHILLSPDGQLNLIPFEALKDENNQYLVERYSFSYLTTGRDLLRFDIKAKKLSNPVLFANIDYEGYKNITIAKNSNSKNQRSIDFKNLNYDSLPGTSVEGKAIKKIFPNTSLITGKQATEATIKKLKTPSILHLSTHGFFLPDQKVDNNEINKSKPFRLENPLLRSGLALAGFNNRQNKQNNNT
ncbi:MAG: tetratricopeptide repeat protein, partial [Rivularia sp. ALOHA_DT_140]|nr:tetratricopeptide repeat protein [Rivularia sp. ALOHA_DT_140]